MPTTKNSKTFIEGFDPGYKSVLSGKMRLESDKLDRTYDAVKRSKNSKARFLEPKKVK